MRAVRVGGVLGGILVLVLGLAAAALAEKPARKSGSKAAAAASAAAAAVPAGGAAGNLDVVTAEQIAAMAALDLKAVLALLPTLVVEESGGPAGVATLSLRGSGSRQVLVLLDGRRLADARSASFNINDLPVLVERIERVEVLPAPASALYGADALGGVVNIVTRTAGTKPGFTLGGGLGSDGEQRYKGGLQYGVGKVGLRLDGQQRTGDGFRDNADFELKNYAASLGVVPAPWGVDVNWSSLERSSGVPGPEALPTPNARQEDSRDELRAAFTYLPGSGWGVKAGVFSQNRSLRFDDPNPPAANPLVPAEPIAASHENKSHGFDAKCDFATSRGELYSFGGEWVTDAVESSTDGNHDTDRWGVYAQDQWRAGSWSAVGAIRRDEHALYGDHTVPSLSGMWEAGGWKVWVSWAEGYRAPDTEELYRNETFFQGNPDLQPETSESYEGGMELAGAGGRVRVKTFRRTVDNLIRWADPDGDLVYRTENVQQALISGYEAEMLYRISPTLSIPVGYQLLSAEDEGTGERLPGSVRSLWRAAIQSSGTTFSWSLEYAATDRGDFQYREGAWRSSVLNAALTWRQTLGSLPLQVSLRGENLRNRSNESVEGYPQPGRTWFAEVRIGL